MITTICNYYMYPL